MRPAFTRESTMMNPFGARRLAFVLAFFATVAFPPAATAAPPQTINYQGSLSSAGNPVNGATSVTFRLYDVSTGGAALWTEAQSVNVVNGLFSVALGATTTFASANLAFDVPYFLGIAVGADIEMTPRPPLTSAPYALRAQTAEGLTALRIVPNAGNSSLIGGATNNTAATASASVISGGGGSGAVVGGPEAVNYSANSISGAAHASVISGGTGNLIEYNANAKPVFASIVGGQNNKNYSYFGFVGGGRTNSAGQVAASIFGATVVGGFGNSAFGSYSAIGGGSGNQAAPFAAVPGGLNNLALGQYSFAGGRGAYSSNDAPGTIRHHGAFVWADSNANDANNQQNFFSTAVDQFAVRARGGVAFRVVGTTNADTGAGCSLPAGGAASWSCSSDRNLKEAITAISPLDVLAKVAALPLSTWSFKGTDRRHMGPMAQDFRAAFGLGVDDKNITTSDVGGVALAAIQGLYQLLQERDGEIARLKSNEQEFAKLKHELTEIKSALGLK
jgi:hypothetical protein